MLFPSDVFIDDDALDALFNGLLSLIAFQSFKRADNNYKPFRPPRIEVDVDAS